VVELIEDAVIAVAHQLHLIYRTGPKQTAEDIARRVLAEYERVKAAALSAVPLSRAPWRVGNPELRERPNDLYEADRAGRWRYIGSLATPEHATWCAVARDMLAGQRIDEAYRVASSSADAFRARLTAALGLPENPGDAVLIASAERAIRIARGLPRNAGPPELGQGSQADHYRGDG
jgi:hypothetical protein